MRDKRIRCPECKEGLQLPGRSSTQPHRDRVQARKEPPRNTSRRDDRRASRPSRRNDYDDRDDLQRKRSTLQDAYDGRDDYDDDRSPRRARKKSKKESGSPTGLIIGLSAGGGGLLLIAIAVIVWVGSSGSNDTPQKDKTEQKSQPQAKGPKAPNLNPAIPQPKPADPQGNIKAETVRKTKEATVYLRVTSGGGQVGEGSGFFAIEPGVVITNAHVLGMLSKTSQPPRKVEVVLHSGEPNERRLVGKVLGVDRTTDLAVVRVPNTGTTPLALGTTDGLVETQKVWIFGFPLGKELGNNITVSDSTVSSLRKDAAGTLQRIQVNGGMHPGNSGGPVVDSAGNVVGVSVAGIRGTQINFAVPAPYVRMLLNGRLLSSEVGEPYATQGSVRVPIRCACLDPFKKIQRIQVEVWPGRPGKDRPPALSQPQAQAGDGAKQVYPVSYQNGIATAEVTVPAVNAGEVVWIQPSVVSSNGTTQWGPAVTTHPKLAIAREPVTLAVNLFAQKKRTVQLSSSQSIEFIKSNKSLLASADAKVAVAELMLPDKLGAVVPTGFGGPVLGYTDAGHKSDVPKAVVSLLSRVAPRFLVDKTNKLRVRADVTKRPSHIPIDTWEEMQFFYKMICNGYEMCNIVIPNRQLTPKETWRTKVPMLLFTGKKATVADLNLLCVYQGVRTVNGTKHAVVTLSGRVEGRLNMAGKVDGQVKGTFSFDVQNGYIASAQMTIQSETALTSEVQVVGKFDVRLKRTPGNPMQIVYRNVPGKGGGGIRQPGPGPGRIVANLVGALSPTDLRDRQLVKKGFPMKVLTVQLIAGKTYTISLSSSAFDTYLGVVSPQRKLIARDDDGGGGLNSRVVFRAPTTGSYRLLVTTYNGQVGPYRVTVQESR